MPRQRARFVPTSTPRTSSVRWSGSATRTTDRVGKQKCCAWSMSSPMDYVNDTLKATIARPRTPLGPRSPDVRWPPRLAVYARRRRHFCAERPHRLWRENDRDRVIRLAGNNIIVYYIRMKSDLGTASPGL